MHITSTAIIVAALALDAALAQPAVHRAHKRLHRLDLAGLLHKEKRQDWNNPALYAGIDWSTVHYTQAAAPAATPAPTPAAAASPSHTPTPAAAPSSSNAPEKLAVAAPAQTQASTSNTNIDNTGGGKRGLAYDYTSPKLDMFTQFSKITWGYNWASTSNGLLPSKFQYVPMLKDPSFYGGWDSAVKAATSGSGTHYLMSFNEPDLPSQANMDLGSAVAGYRQYMSKYASGNVKIGSPAVTSSENKGQGLDYLGQFFQQCSGCPIDFVPIHWYGSDAGQFKDHVSKAIALAPNNAPVWVTEFQCQGGDQNAFLADVLPWLDSQGRVARYAYFMASNVDLTNGNALTALGQKYGSA